MQFLTEKRFSFVSAGFAAETFGVVHFTGTEAISSLFEFNITLVTDDPNLDLDAILRGPATFSIHRPNDQQVDFTGILSQFEQLHAFNECIFYRAQLRPRLWWLTLTHHNQVCLNLPVVSSPASSPQTSLIGRILIDGGLTALDFAFRNQKTYAPQDYVCQYDESHYAFFCRWLEREGLYYFFEQTDGVDKVVITDSMISQMDFPQEGNLIYAPPSGLEGHHQDEVITNLICRQKMLPQKVLLRDHNYERPSLELTGTAMVDPQGRGESYVYGEYFRTPEEGNRLAKIYAESLFCRKRECIGESTVPFMMPGYTFSLTNHYRDDFNRKYLVCEVHHEGNQTGYLISGLQGALPDIDKTISYRNTFVAIPADIQYRAERLTAKPRISGTLHAVVDAEGSGEYAELDDQGRYKVRLPFDINAEHGAGKASCFLRMAQPYAGPKRGMHFPLPKGTEVLLTFIGGDPDRPVIASAVPNPETPSPSTARNQTESVIQTGSNNKIRMEDKMGKERIIMESPKLNSFIRIGTHNDPPPEPNAESDEAIGVIDDPDGLKLQTLGRVEIFTGNSSGEFSAGTDQNINIGCDQGDINLKTKETPSGGAATRGNLNLEAYDIYIKSTGTELTEDIAGSHKENVNGNILQTVGTATAPTVTGSGNIAIATSGNMTQTIGGNIIQAVNANIFQVVNDNIIQMVGTVTEPTVTESGHIAIATSGNMTQTIGGNFTVATAATVTSGDTPVATMTIDTTGKISITTQSQAIDIKSNNGAITINSGSGAISITGTGTTEVKGQTVNVTSTGETNVSASKIKLNC